MKLNKEQQAILKNKILDFFQEDKSYIYSEGFTVCLDGEFDIEALVVFITESIG